MKFIILSSLLLLLPFWLGAQNNGSTTNFNKKLVGYLDYLSEDFDQIPLERKIILESIGIYIYEQKRVKNTANVSFLSKKNEQRTQLCQVWLDAAAKYYGVSNINSFSAGFSPGEFSPKVADALQRVGFFVEKMRNGGSPTYQVSIKKNGVPILTFSKPYYNPLNPTSNYAAVFVQEHPDSEKTMLSEGADVQYCLPFLVPVAFDNKTFEKEEYDLICQQIGREMLYLMYTASQRMN